MINCRLKISKAGSRKNQRGVVLLFVLASLLTIGIAATAFFEMGLHEQRFSTRGQSVTQAFLFAESAVDQGLQWLRNQAQPPAGSTPLVLSGGYQPLGTGFYLTTVTPAPSNVSSYLKRYSLQGIGVDGSLTAPTALRQTTLVVQVESFARYAYFTDQDISPSGQTVWFITGDHIEGPTHTNGQLNVYGNPIFDGAVSSVAANWNPYNSSAQPTFKQGFEGGVPSKPFPTSFPTALNNAGGSGGTVFQGDTSVTLVSDGTMKVTNAAAGYVNKTVPLPGNGVLLVQGGSLNLQGTLKGQLTAATTTGDVNIVGSVRYSDDPRVNPASTDVLGIVAGGNVVVPTTAPTNVEVDASIMALSTSFTVQNYWVGPAKGTLTLYGGMSQQRRGPVGTFSSSSGQRLSGYTKDYHYDQRLLSAIPPYFPVTGDYVSLVWQEAS